MLEEYIKKLNEEGEIHFDIRVNPNADKTELKSIMADGSLKINIKAIPEKGKANLELINFLSKEFKILKDNVKVISGFNNRFKLIKIIKK